MAEVKNTGYLSIGEVLGLLLEDFPDVTISKIRFLESQGLISPERTSSGYRKFYDADVELLRVILTEQRSNYLPLRVIKDRLETGEIDPTGEHLRPDDEESDPTGDPPESHEELAAPPFEATVPTSSISAHPASGGNPAHPSSGGNPDREAARQAAASNGGSEPAADQMSVLSGLLIDGTELCALVGMDDAELEHLESFGIIAARDGSTPALYDEDAVQIAKPACELLRAGVDARHLRNWRTSAEREASLYEQLVTPRFRQRNPASRAEALEQLRRLDVLGGDLRAAMTRHALRRHFEST